MGVTELAFELYNEVRVSLNTATAVPQWMKERGIFVIFIYRYYVNYDDCGAAVAAFENTY